MVQLQLRVPRTEVLRTETDIQAPAMRGPPPSTGHSSPRSSGPCRHIAGASPWVSVRSTKYAVLVVAVQRPSRPQQCGGRHHPPVTRPLGPPVRVGTLLGPARGSRYEVRSTR